MADFKKALEALGKGSIDASSLVTQLTTLLDQTPQHAIRMLSYLDEAYNRGAINDQDYIKLKNHINQYRKAHSIEDEGSDVTEIAAGSDNITGVDPDATEIDPDATEVASDITGSDPDATEIAPSSTGSDPDATEIDPSSTGSDPDATEIDPNVTGIDPDATEINDEATAITSGPAASDATLIDSNTQQTGGTSFDVTSGDMSDIEIDLSKPAMTGTAWSDPSSIDQGESNFGPGSIIKQRFKLIKVLGVGGMGKVYKGLDLLKEEAKDKKPYVAIKLLNEDFKDHPEAFISLQRESSRQQKLAHPNIATIYDFDRVGGPGTPVYITMELMEGMELKDFIKKKVKKQGGLPFDKAFKIIKQLVAGLAYAHARRLVHSDFKPGNCFLCDDGTVKTLDFGIARAVKNPVTGEAEKTLFDPGKLGALTPAYASFEMLEGEEPDTRDDIYALGCVSYELLTGRHPFDKLPANKAKAGKLKPIIVKGLKKKQNRALQRSVAFARKDRPATVDAFLTELEAKYVWHKSPLTVAAIILTIAVLAGTGPVINYYHQKKIEQFVTDINTGNPQIIIDRLANIDNFEKADQRVITDDAKNAIQNYFRNKVLKLVDASTSNYNFLKAEEVLAEVNKFYPDSNFLEEQISYISTNKKQRLSALYSKFSDMLVSAKEQDDAVMLENAKNILEEIRTRIDPDDSLLTDPRTGNQYRLLANNAFDLGNYDKALKLISSGLELAPGNKQLSDTKDRIQKTVDIIGLEKKLDGAYLQLTSLEDYQTIKSDTIKLAKLDPENSTLLPISTSLQEYINQKFKDIIDSGTRADAEALVDEYGDLLSALQLNKDLINLKLAKLSEEQLNQSIQALASENISIIKNSLDTADINNPEWEAKILTSVQEVQSLIETNAKEIENFIGDFENSEQSIIALYLDQVRETIDLQRFEAAKDLLDRVTRFAPSDQSDILAMRNTISVAEVAHEKQLLVDGLIKDFRAQATANQITKALEYYERLKAELPENDTFISEEAPTILSASYANLAKESFEATDFTNALKFADEGLKLNPDNRMLRTARAEYAVDANIIDLTEQFNTTLNFDIADVQKKIAEISSSLKFSEFRQKSINLLEKRIKDLRDSDKNIAAKLAQDAAIFFPGSTIDELTRELKIEPWANTSTTAANLNSGKLTEAQTILQATVGSEFEKHPDVVAFNELLETYLKRANQVFDEYLAEKNKAGTDYQGLRLARKMLARAQSLWIDNPEYDAEETKLDELIIANTPTTKKVMARENIDLNVAGTDTDGEVQKWQPIDSGRTCENRLAGYGKRARAICYDFINNGWRGPLMVVIPSGGEFSKNFAIGKYEISVGDYSKYCAISKSCTPERNKEKFNEPLTDISIKEAQAYAEWIAKRTGKKYRLPTKSEWEYAANANGKQPRKDYNCRVALGDKIVKGTGITNIKSGQSNGWGLKNYIGNVQEWVVDKDDQITAKGGAFHDPHSKCSVSFSKEHDGQADKETGFRLVLEEVG